MTIPSPDQRPLPPGTRAIMLLATGFGLGHAKKAPGTFGSLLGPPLVWLLGCDSRHPWISLAAAVAAYVLGTMICNVAVRVFQAKDPQSVVVDEYLAFLWIYVLTPINWMTAIAGYILFRIFDIAKPWPLRKLERLPGGWGIMSDDAAAGMISGVLLAIGWRLTGW